MIVIQDTREQNPLKLNFETIVTKLDTGDYSIQGREKEICIERKGKIAEFYQNCVQKRFWKEMDRILDYPHRYLILEFTPEHIDNIPYSLNLPKRVWSKMKISPKYIWKCLHKIQYEYGVIALFTGSRENSIKVVEDIILRLDENKA
jgi:ERCC4-type nuclease